MAQIYIGIGANLGAARETVLAAIDELAALAQTRLNGCSSLYRSRPIDSSGDDYINAVVAAQTGLAPLAVLEQLQQIENRHGRQRPYLNAPRTLDLDLLLHGDQCIESTRLTLPHPRLHLRAFVLLPLAELAPTLQIPGRGPIGDWLAGVAGQGISRLDDPAAAGPTVFSG